MLNDGIPVNELAKILRGLRETRSVPTKHVQARLDQCSHAFEKATFHPLLKRGIAEFERKGDRLTTEYAVGSKDAHQLAEVYEIESLLLDPFFAKPTPENLPSISQLFADFVEPLKEFDLQESKEVYGKRVKYTIPCRRMANVDSAVIYLELEPDGETHPHSHPGDEYLYMLEGEGELEFLDLGFSVPLRKGDYIHFYGEQRHLLRHTSGEKCEAFIIRCLQIMPEGTRAAALKVAKKLLSSWPKMPSGLDEEFTKTFAIPYIQHWVTSSHTPRGPREMHSVSFDATPETPVVDNIGLALLLRHYEKPAKGKDPRFNRDGLVKRASSDEVGWKQLSHSQRTVDKNFFVDLFKGVDTGLVLQDLGHLAKLTKIHEPLFQPFLFPIVPRLCVVRDQEKHKDWCKLPQVAPGVQYYAPIRRLGGSDTTIALVELEGGQATGWNDHPGYELVIPLSGNAVVEFENPKDASADLVERTIGSNNPGFLMYRSKYSHRVKNPDSNSPTRMLVIRLYDSVLDDPK